MGSCDIAGKELDLKPEKHGSILCPTLRWQEHSELCVLMIWFLQSSHMAPTMIVFKPPHKSQCEAVFSEWVNEWSKGEHRGHKLTFNIYGTVNIDTFIFFLRRRYKWLETEILQCHLCRIHFQVPWERENYPSGPIQRRASGIPMASRDITVFIWILGVSQAADNPRSPLLWPLLSPQVPNVNLIRLSFFHCFCLETDSHRFSWPSYSFSLLGLLVYIFE